MRWFVVAALLTFPIEAWAQTASAPARAPSARDQAILRGVEAYRAQRWEGAVSAFREAAGLDGASALPQLYLGYTAAARGDIASAQGFYREALRLATVAADEGLQARARIAIAMLLETAANWDGARTQWSDYVRFAEGHTAAAPAAIGRARLDAFTRRAAVEQASEPVRRRIEERLRVNASGANQVAPPGMAPVPTGGAR